MSQFDSAGDRDYEAYSDLGDTRMGFVNMTVYRHDWLGKPIVEASVEVDIETGFATIEFADFFDENGENPEPLELEPKEKDFYLTAEELESARILFDKRYA
jgi:hypothetical protein